MPESPPAVPLSQEERAIALQCVQPTRQFVEATLGPIQSPLGYSEPEPPPVPFDKRGKVLTLDEAAPLMEGWEFRGGFGSPDCYAVNIWTTRRVIWVTQYDGSTQLSAAPRHPVETIPDMPGG